MEKKANESRDTLPVKSLVIVFSYHHNNTEKIANTCAKVLGAEVRTADRLQNAAGKKAFLFSTYGAPAFIANREFIEKNHRQIREKLQAKGYTVIGEFGCAGWNTNSFLRFFGGLNKGRPNAEDLRNAEEFARSVKGKARG